MRNFSLLISAIAIFFIGCQADALNEVVGTDTSKSNTITISLKSTRTALGDKGSDGQYPLYWSEGDCIVANVVESNPAVIDPTNPSTASFSFEDDVTYPCNVTYPYYENTSKLVPRVFFPTEQDYVEGSFSLGSAPMCAYIAAQGDAVELKHLSGVLRFPIKASSEGTVLSKVVITSSDGAKLSGEFNVNCQTATLRERDAGLTSVTYNLPTNFSLSTTEEQVFYIALPATDVGYCTVEFIETNGAQMTLGWNGNSVKAGVVREFKTITYKSQQKGSLDPFEIEEDVIITASVSGYVLDSNGKPIEGVAVSDGFTIVTTDSNGFYTIDASKDAWHIYITVPAEYEIPVKNNQPAFYQKYDSSKYRYDFTLTPLAGGKEDKVALFILGDPQVATQNGLDRLNGEAVPAIQSHAATWQAQGVPCYGVTLGDMISNNNSSDRSEWRDDVFESFAVSNAGMPVFHIMGNHDNTYFNASNPIYADERSSSFELKAQREHEDVFGPVNFSFDRGDMHIIGMRNVKYNVNNDCDSGLRRSFLDEHYEWLKQDLALVPKDKMIVFCVHIQMENGGGNHVQEVFALLNEYKEVHIMTGHSHIIRAFEYTDPNYPNLFEHNMGALCGAWWTSYMCGDGSPCGFGVFVNEGDTFTDWYHIGYSTTAKNRSHQMRLYRGNTIAGGTQKTGAPGYYAFNFDEDVLLANVYMADSKWKIEVYEDGVYSGEMERVSVESGFLSESKYYARPKIYRNETSTPSSDGAGYGYMLGDGSSASPYRSTIPTAADIYFSGYINGVRGFGDHSLGSNSQCYHMYMYKLKKGSFDNIKVVATDKFGNEYTETEITEGTDYSTVQY